MSDLTNSSENGSLRIDAQSVATLDKRSIVAVGAGILIGLGIVLQWLEAPLAHFFSENSWLFATLFGEAWNMVNVWLLNSAQRQEFMYWPLVLVVTGGAILFSRCAMCGRRMN